MNHYNVAQTLAEMAGRAPFRPAILFPAGRDAQGRAKFTQLSFQQLNNLVDSYAHGLVQRGVAQGDRTLLLVKPGVDLIAVTFALLKVGAVPILIDPGMGRAAFLQCVRESEPTTFIGLPIAHALRRLFPQPFKMVQHHIIVSELKLMRGLGDIMLSELARPQDGAFTAVATTEASEAAITFTSGSTGIPKGVIYTHGMFRAQIEIFRTQVGIKEGEIDLPGLYIFALFNPALGVTTVLPDMDARKSASVNPAYLVEAIQTHGVTTSFGSPTIWKRVLAYCQAHHITLPSLKRVFMAGIPVPPQLVKDFLPLMNDGEVYTPYGATEALPLTMMSGQELGALPTILTSPPSPQPSPRGRGSQINSPLPLGEGRGEGNLPLPLGEGRGEGYLPLPLGEGRGEGYLALGGHYGVCVGRTLEGITIRVIRLSDYAIEKWNDSLELPLGQVGEIVVKGSVVTHEYLHRPYETTKAKIKEADGTLWHRMGDMGFLDEAGRLWFCGRKAHRVETAQGLMLPIPCEAIFNQHHLVNRTALVGLGARGQQRPVLIVEPIAGHTPTLTNIAGRRLKAELLELGAEYAHTQAIQEILFYPRFPVDVRHNAKIQQETLAEWARKKLGIRN